MWRSGTMWLCKFIPVAPQNFVASNCLRWIASGIQASDLSLLFPPLLVKPHLVLLYPLSKHNVLRNSPADGPSGQVGPQRREQPIQDEKSMAAQLCAAVAATTAPIREEVQAPDIPGIPLSEMEQDRTAAAVCHDHRFVTVYRTNAPLIDVVGTS